MGDGGWTHEQLNVLDELKAGRANELIAYLLSGQPINDDLETIINKYLNTGSFSWQSSTPKRGRPKSSNWDEWTCLGLYRRKRELQAERPKMRVIDIEHEMATAYGLNEFDLRKNIKRGKDFVEFLASKPDMGWAKDLLEQDASTGKKK